MLNQIIKELEQLSKSEETPYITMDGDKRSFEKGWYLAINRILNKIKGKR